MKFHKRYLFFTTWISTRFLINLVQMWFFSFVVYLTSIETSISQLIIFVLPFQRHVESFEIKFANILLTILKIHQKYNLSLLEQDT